MMMAIPSSSPLHVGSSSGAVLCCPACKAELLLFDSGFSCSACGERYPVVNGIPRLLVPAMRDALSRSAESTADERRIKTAQSFGSNLCHMVSYLT
jgi:uncharacterized protein YbaR (Trm112 family)